MDSNSTKKKKSYALLAPIYFIAAFALFFAVTVFVGNEIRYINNTAQLDGFDFSSHIAYISTNVFERYLEAHYTPEDFAQGRITHAPDVQDGRSSFATYRILLPLIEGVAYGISGYSATFAMTLWLDGVVYVSVGEPGSRLEDMNPRREFFTAYFIAGAQPTEIVIQSSSFVHATGGGLNPIYIAEQPLIISMNRLNHSRVSLMVGMTLMAALLFMGLFLFFDNHLHFLWFSGACLVIALRAIVMDFVLIMTLFPRLEWQLIHRLEYLSATGFVIFTILYVSAMFKNTENPYGLNRIIKICVLLYLSFLSVFVLVVPSTLYTQHHNITNIFMILSTGLILLNMAWIITTDPKRRRVEHVLVFLGSIANILLGMGEIILRFDNPRFVDVNFVQIGAMVFVFVNAIALALNFRRTEESERRLAAENAILDNLLRMKTEFLKDIQHEVRSPLLIISTGTDYTIHCLDMGGMEQELRGMQGTIQNEAMRLGRMINGMVELATETAVGFGASIANRQKIDFADMLKTCAQNARLMIEQRGNILTVEIAPGLPHVYAEAEQLNRVPVNLFSNAVYSTENGRITIGATADDGYITVQITDTGAGIAADLLPHVFERGISGKGGKGYGLSICKTIVEAHGGTIEIASEQGKGTSVIFTIPVYGGQSEAGRSAETKQFAHTTGGVKIE